MDTFINRIPVSWRSPNYHRSQTLRKVLATALLLAAALMFLNEQSARSHTYVVAKTDLAPGTVLTSAHVEKRSLPMKVDIAAPVPDPDSVLGRVVATPMKPGEFLQDHHLLGAELSQAFGSSSLVPIKLSDPAAAELAVPGAVVSVVAAHSDAEVTTIAEGARVVFGTERKTDSTEAGTVLLAMDEASATRVAAASLGVPLTVVLTPRV